MLYIGIWDFRSYHTALQHWHEFLGLTASKWFNQNLEVLVSSFSFWILKKQFTSFSPRLSGLVVELTYSSNQFGWGMCACIYLFWFLHRLWEKEGTKRKRKCRKHRQRKHRGSLSGFEREMRDNASSERRKTSHIFSACLYASYIRHTHDFRANERNSNRWWWRREYSSDACIQIIRMRFFYFTYY